MTPLKDTPAAAPDFLSGGGEMGALIRQFDWSRTPLGPPSAWSTALRTLVRMLLVNRFPQMLCWGPTYIQIYNDPFRPIPGDKHPRSLGQETSECWPEIWHIIGPLVDTPFKGGEATWNEDLELEIHRSNITEETHFTVACSLVPDETASRGIGGVLATVHEITEKVIGERRVLVLRDLGTRASAAKTAEEACAVAAATLANHPKDIPFAALYLLDAASTQSRLAAQCSLDGAPELRPPLIAMDDSAGAIWPLAAARNTEQMQIVETLASKFHGSAPGPWSDPPHTAVVVPIQSNIAHQLAGFLVAGVSARLRLDSAYKDFLHLATDQIASAIANAKAYEEERKRAEALAEIDRAKTAFFSNVSHEFRTPLTLMLGPLESVLSNESGSLDLKDRDQIETAHRNSLRLLKLVNSLLDFARIEAGRASASYTPVDLAGLTAGLASNFRALMENAGLEYMVDCPPLPHPVYVDVEMWEKIVLNLLSNAFKFTFEGRIAVNLEASNGHAKLTVADTGAGIPEQELPRIFERFHRVEGVKGRAYEGTGIGLALTQELVRFHGGSVHVSSRAGEGSAFTVTIPFGSAHLPRERIGAAAVHVSTAVRSDAFLAEAQTWTANAPLTHVVPEPDSQPPEAPAARPRVLLADDNADMREYVRHVLGSNYDLVAVANGAEALEEARRSRPGLILSDIMMPGLDGYGLLRALRRDPDLREVPIILLSARAGEEARASGIEAGADDYVTKPFSARELLARVRTTLALQQVRQEARLTIESVSTRLQSALKAARMVAWEWNLKTGQIASSANAAQVVGAPVVQSIESGWTCVHPGDEPRLRAAVENAIAQRGEYVEPLRFIRPDSGAVQWMEVHGRVLCDAEGRPDRVAGLLLDITESKRSEAALRESEERFRTLANSSSVLIWVNGADGCEFVNRTYLEFVGVDNDFNVRGFDWARFVHPADRKEHLAAYAAAFEQQAPFCAQFRFRRADGEYRWMKSVALPRFGQAGDFQGYVGSSVDIEEIKTIEQELRRANEDLNQFAFAAGHDLQEPLRMIASYAQMLVKNCPAELNEEADRCVKFITEGTQRMHDLLADLLTYTQMSAGLQRSPAPVDLNLVVERAIANLKTAVDESGAVITHDGLPAVRGEEVHFLQLFQNLIGNAIKYRKSNPRIQVSAVESGDMWRFNVTDNGIGIAPEYHARIFGVFKRLHGKSIPGTGIGLPICQRVVERYGGRIWVESRLDEGSTFYFTLPAANPAPAP